MSEHTHALSEVVREISIPASDDSQINWCAVIVSVFLVACAAIVYATREVDKCFDNYFDELESRD